MLTNLLRVIIWKVNRKHEYMHEMSISKNSVCSNGEINVLHNNLIVTISTVADKLDLFAKPKWRIPGKNPWGNKECKLMRRKLPKSVNVFKRSGFADSEEIKCLEIKRSCLGLRRSKRRQFESSLQNLLAIYNDPKDFWTAVNRFSLRSPSTNNVSLKLWQDLLFSLDAIEVPLCIYWIPR